MSEIKDRKLAKQIEKNPITPEQFNDTLKRVCKRIEKPKPSPKQSKT